VTAVRGSRAEFQDINKSLIKAWHPSSASTTIKTFRYWTVTDSSTVEISSKDDRVHFMLCPSWRLFKPRGKEG